MLAAIGAWMAQRRHRILVDKIEVIIREAIDQHLAGHRETMHQLDLEAAVVARRLGEHLAAIRDQVLALKAHVDASSCLAGIAMALAMGCSAPAVPIRAANHTAETIQFAEPTEPCHPVPAASAKLYEDWGRRQDPPIEHKDCAENCPDGLRLCRFEALDRTDRWATCNGRDHGPICQLAPRKNERRLAL